MDQLQDLDLIELLKYGHISIESIRHHLDKNLFKNFEIDMDENDEMESDLCYYGEIPIYQDTYVYTFTCSIFTPDGLEYCSGRPRNPNTIIKFNAELRSHDNDNLEKFNWKSPTTEFEIKTIKSAIEILTIKWPQFVSASYKSIALHNLYLLSNLDEFVTLFGKKFDRFPKKQALKHFKDTFTDLPKIMDSSRSLIDNFQQTSKYDDIDEYHEYINPDDHPGNK